MSHYVKCKICGERFDRDATSYVQVSKQRYAHAECYLRERAKDTSLPQLEITDPTNFVTCVYCKKTIDKTKDAYKQIGNKKYAHLSCLEIEEKREKTEAEKLDLYIMKLFKWDYVKPRVKKQISQYIDEYNFTYSGIRKALMYFYEIKGKSLDKAQGGIGIVPYIYQDAYNYYYALWEAQQKNKDIVVEQYVPQVKEIFIPIPERKTRTRKLFTFLDEEE